MTPGYLERMNRECNKVDDARFVAQFFGKTWAQYLTLLENQLTTGDYRGDGSSYM